MPPGLSLVRPTNSAESRTESPRPGDHDAHWERTRDAEERLPSIERAGGIFKGRAVIHRDSRIDGGVCVGAHGREAIVVDWRDFSHSRSPYSLNQMYKDAVKLATVHGKFQRGIALQAVYDVVDQLFQRRTSEGVDEVNRRARAGVDDKIHIQCYIAARTGVCRHMALACAAILERMVDEKLLFGKVSNDRNSLPGGGAHAWCRYTSSSGKVFVLDVMQGYFGGLDEARYHGTWDYQRPEERTRVA